MSPSLTHWIRRAGLVLGLVLTHSLQAAPAALPNVATDQTIGTINCASSTCHGSIAPWNESNVLQNEYTTWSRLDRHAKAYTVLLNKQSQRIAKNLGLAQPAHESKICLDCHSHNPDAKNRGPRHVVSDGVSCEGCHGPAGKWVTSHTVANVPHAENVANGLYPTSRPVEQAKLCLSCHFGNDDRFVTHRIMGAGHPRMAFEIETFGALEPAHYKVDTDYVRRKGEYNPVRLWAIGQAYASQQLLDTLGSSKRGRDGLFPELVLFDCHACHHPMSEQKASLRLGVGSGRVNLNDNNLLMLRAIVRVIDPANSAAFDRQVSQVHHAVAGSADQRAADPVALAKNLSATIGRYMNRFEQETFDATVLRNILLALLDETSANQYANYAGAEQAYFSISSLTSSLIKQGGLAASGPVTQRLTSMRKALANEDKFRGEQFLTEVAAMRALIPAQAK
ncbi:MAG: hypothetical protein EBR45_04140 [Betaproteobacteria bacterium]|jgi:hypothetical protein|nr:hypothetical protein [Betaproteobacteria bacterium]